MYYHHHLDTLDDGQSPLPNINVLELCLCLDINVQMGHNQRDTLRLLVNTRTVFHGLLWNTKKRDRFYHMQRFQHFSDDDDDDNEPDKTDESYDWLWKMTAVFDRHNNFYAKYYILTEHLAGDEITMFFRGRIIFKHYTPKKYTWFGIKLYNCVILWDILTIRLCT
jgi:hypothetical protein